MKGKILFLAFISLILTGLAAVPPVQDAFAGAQLPPCTSRAFYFDIVGSVDKPFIFVVEMKPEVKANWTMYLTRDNPETLLGITSSCSIDSAVLSAQNYPNSLVIEKSCNDVEGRWYLIVESDSTTTARFTMMPIKSKVITDMPNLVVAENSRVPFSAAGTKTAPLPIIDAIERWDFFNISFPAIPFGANILIEISSSVNAPLSKRLSFAGDRVNSRCRSTRTYDAQLEIPYCEASKGGFWRLTIGRTVANQGYRVKAYFDRPTIVAVGVNQKVTSTLNVRLETIYYSFSGPWPAGEAMLVPVVDNVVGGSVALKVSYDELPFSSCSSMLPGCSTNRGCHVIVPPCKNLKSREKMWYAGVQVSTLKASGTPLTLTFSWAIYPVVPETIKKLDPIIGDLRNGQLKHYYIPAQMYSVVGTWLRIHVYIDATRRSQVEGLNGFLYISNRKNPGPAGDGCSSSTKFCSLAQTRSEFMSCSLQLDPCELSTQHNTGIYFSLVAIAPRDELWFQEDLSYTILVTTDVVPTARNENSPFLLDTGDVVSSVIPERQYTFYRVPSHKGSLMITLSSPDYTRPPSGPALSCLNYTIGGLTECLDHAGCGWCNRTCVPCTGKVGDVVYCSASSVYGCSAPPPPPDSSVPDNPVYDNCSPLSNALCVAEGLSGVCGWCGATSTCGSCVRNLVTGDGKWCPGEVPVNCEKVRVVSTNKRSVEQAALYKPLQLQLVISYDAASQGPSCACWKPYAVVDVYQGKTAQFTLDACRADKNRALYVGVYGAFSTNYTTPWMCILGFAFPVKMNANGDIECMSLNGVNCLSNALCSTSIASTNPSKIVPVTCGEELRKRLGFTGYDNPDHWCARSLAFFDTNFISYSENPYTLSVKEYSSSGFGLIPLPAKIVHESPIKGGDTDYLQLDFPRTDIIRKTLVVKAKGHPNSGITTTLGFLEGDPTDEGRCYRFAEQEKVCTFTEANGGLCILTWGKCDWRQDFDNRPFVIRVHRSGNKTLTVNDATDLYNAQYEVVDEYERELKLGEVVPDVLYDGLYHHFNLTLGNNTAGKELVIEAYFDAGHALSTGDSLNLYLNSPGQPYLAGDVADCYCSQELFSDPQKILVVLDECDVKSGTYHLAVRALQVAVDPFGIKYTITSYLRNTTRQLVWDQPTDYSSFLEQRTRYRFNVSPSMTAGLQNPNTTLSITLSTYKKDIAALTLHKGNESVCGCHNPVAECVTTSPLAGRPTCTLQVDWCKLWGSGDYFITVTPRQSEDVYTAMAYTLQASTTSGVQTIAALRPARENCLDASTNYTLNNLRTQHFAFNLATPLQTDEILEVYVTKLRYGSLTISANDVGLATSQCSATTSVRCLPEAKFCLIQLACVRQIRYFSVTAKSLENNEPVKFSISSCITRPVVVSLNSAASPVTVAASATVTLELPLKSLSLAQTPTIALKIDQVASLPYRVALDQGLCSGCSSFSRYATCAQGSCWLFLHWSELPPNWNTTRWMVHLDNPNNSDGLSLTFEARSVTLGSPVALTTNSASALGIPPGSWGVFRWSINAGEAAKNIGLRTGSIFVQVTQPMPVPDTSDAHKVSFIVTNAPIPTTDKVVYRPAKGSSASIETGRESISVCCLTEGEYYAYVWNGHPSTTWTVSVSASLTEVSNQVAGLFDTANSIPVGAGSAITNVYIPFPGVKGLKKDVGSRLVAEVVGNGLDAASSLIYFNVGGPSGPRTTCTWNIEQAGGLRWSRDWYSCDSKPLDADIYWFGLVSGSTSRAYAVTLRQVDPIVGFIAEDASNVWTTPLRSSPTRFHQFRFDLDQSLTTFGVQLIAQIEILPESVGSVDMLWNVDQPADATRDCATNRGSVVATRTSPTSHTPGKINLPVCLDGFKSVYLGVRPSCPPGSASCFSDSPNNPQYRVRIISLQTFTTTLRNIQLNTPSEVLNAAPNTPYLFSYAISQTFEPTEYLRLLVTNLRWTSTPGNITISWIRDGSCRLHNDDDDCNAARTECAAIVFPCEYAPSNMIKFRVSVNQPVSYTVRLSLSNGTATNVPVGESRKVALKEESLAFFRVNLRDNIGKFGPGDFVSIKLSDVTCGNVRAWINRGFGAGPACNIGTPCTKKGCVLWSSSACNLMTKDRGGDFFVTVRGLDQFTTSDASVTLQVTAVTDGKASTNFITMHDNEEQHLSARGLKPVPNECSTEALPIFESCCSAKALLSNNDTRSWVPDDVHYVYTVEGGHHLGYGAVITVAVRPQVSHATVSFVPDYPVFCGNKGTTCIATTGKPCTYQVNSCIRSTRQIFVWVNPDSVKWVGGAKPLVAPEVSTVQVASIRVDNKEVALFDVAPTDRLPSKYHAQFHPFWLLPGEMEYIQISHPSDYANETNYHVRVEIEEIFDGTVEIIQDSAWTPCVTGECQVSDCMTRPAANQCILKYGPCYCANYNQLDIPPCHDTAATGNVEQYDDDKADHLIIRALGTGSSSVRGRIRFHFWEDEEDINPQRCEVVRTGEARFFDPKLAPKANQIYKFTIEDMEEDYGAVRMSVNDNKVALAGVSCAEKAFCVANGNSCTIYYRRAANTAPRVSVKGDGSGRKYFGNHHFYLEATLVTLDIVELSVGVANVSPVLKATGENCLKPVAPQYYRYQTLGTGDFIVVRLVAHNARAWINEGHVTHGWGKWVCDGRNTGGICEVVIACDFNKRGIYYIHVEGSSHELTVFEHTVETQEIAFGETAHITRFATSPYYAVRLNNVGASQDDPMKNLRIRITGQLLETWLTADKFGDRNCRIPRSSDVVLANAINGETFVHTIPACHLHVNRSSAPIVANILRKFHRSNDPACLNYDLTITSDFVVAHSALANFTGAGKGPYRVRPNINGVARSLHRVDLGPLTDNDVVFARIARSNLPVTHTVWKGNYVTIPKYDFCSRDCFSLPQTNGISWFDSCWHCGGSSYETVFVEVAANTTDVALVYDLEVTKVPLVPITSDWTNYTLRSSTRDVRFFRLSVFNKTWGNAFEIFVTGSLGVEVEVYPADCHRRESGPIELQPLVYRCYPGHVCDISFPRRSNYGSKSTLESRIWSDDSLRFLVKGYNTDFRIRSRVNVEQLCNPITDFTLVPYCSTHLRQDGKAWGTSNVTWTAQDRWATSFTDKLIKDFDCPVEDKCQCKPVSDLCKEKIKSFACELAFGTCSPDGFRRTARLNFCSEVEGACGKSFASVGLGWLDCRHAFYYGQKILTDTDGCDIIEGCPQVEPPAVPTPQPQPAPPKPAPEPTDDIEDYGLTLAAKLGIGLAFLALLILLGLVVYFGIVSPRMAFRNTIEGEGYEIM